MKNLPQAVQSQSSTPVMIWANFMGLVLVAGSAIFMFSHTAALFVFVATMAAFVIAFALYQFRPNIYVIGVPQLFLWTPLVIYLYRTEFADGAADASQAFTIWLGVALVTMVISILFDMRALYLVVTQGLGNEAGTQ